ncbi:sodium:proton antiporter [Skermanella stibiiresistens SB22]|uniref:Sodium:proton antiporter n=1 Tax=Skermanella stibiiresistens SB22 TaxID=1385369 RepID=W9H8W8_9PROT|nr:YbaL family putative K(+) efflux transporter [Skermanella stibiiresistens]EWY41166.1 sodium:proton antiporter [Skermanella stibiiresistens SB22]
MPGHDTPLVAVIAIGLALAFVLGLLAHRFRISPLVGYLLAGIVVGPFTPGFVADQGLANELAEIGVILLMFAVGLHFSFKDLMSVRKVALPGAVVQISVATGLGMALAWSLGWTMGAGIVFGLALSVASTVVLIRALQERRVLDTERGRIAVGWLIVEDLAMVMVLVMLPAVVGLLADQEGVADWRAIALSAGFTLVKVATFVVIMLVAGRRIIPWIMHYAAHTGSRELFRLSVYAVALGIAYGAAALFGVSFALGAFFAGMVLAESPLSQRATEEALPLRDAFAVLFFVSVGMLFDPGVLVRSPWAVLATVAIIVVGKSIAAFGIVKVFGRSTGTAMTISASLAQIGEFSFILAGLGVGMGVMPEEGRDLILAGAIISIMLNPLIFAVVERRRKTPDKKMLNSPDEFPLADPSDRIESATPPLSPTTLSGHDILVGYGRVGSLVGSGLRAAGRPLLVFEERIDEIAAARRDGAEVVIGNAADPQILATANLEGARRLIVTVPEAFEAGQVVEQARRANPTLEIVARAHTDAAVEHLTSLGATLAVMGEREIALRMLERIKEDDAAEIVAAGIVEPAIPRAIPRE